MKNFGIQTPCKENWNAMTPTEKGAFCQKCASQVIDFTNKSNAEIKSTFRSLSGQAVCSRMNPNQIDSLNLEFESWKMNSKRSVQTAMLFSLIVVFGLTLFSCSTEKEKKTILQMQQAISQSLSAAILPAQTAAVLPAVQKTTAEEVPFISPFPMEEEVAVISQGDPDLRQEIVRINDEQMYIMGMSVRSIDFETFLDEEVVETPVEYDENGMAIPAVFTSKAFPNPATSNTTLEIGLPADDFTEIHLYDLSGKFIQTVFSGDLKRGTHTYPVDLTEFPAGIYLFNIRSATYTGSVRVSKV